MWTVFISLGREIKMEFIETSIQDLVLIKPQVFGDKRGYFIETYNHGQFKQHIGGVNFI